MKIVSFDKIRSDADSITVKDSCWVSADLFQPGTKPTGTNCVVVYSCNAQEYDAKHAIQYTWSHHATSVTSSALDSTNSLSKLLIFGIREILFS